MPSETDNTLVRASLEGDRDAFGELLNRHETRVYNVIMRVTGNREDARDATQSAFLKAYDNLNTFKPEHRFFSWVCRIGVNEALNRIKRDRRTAVLEFEPRAREANPEQKAAGREIGKTVQAALGGLSPEYRVVIVLRHFQGLTYRELAQVTGVPVKTVKSRLFTARQTLRELLIRDGLLR
jgi:RNA polymerase sigma-70 factor (ECF subfamily)